MNRGRHSNVTPWVRAGFRPATWFVILQFLAQCLLYCWLNYQCHLADRFDVPMRQNLLHVRQTGVENMILITFSRFFQLKLSGLIIGSRVTVCLSPLLCLEAMNGKCLGSDGSLTSHNGLVGWATEPPPRMWRTGLVCYAFIIALIISLILYVKSKFW